ncbi:MAG TPA: bacteriochlorophyll 4-vinyl reductase [Rubrivivax sp.]|nr:bacteriochlorophyll 4-vinyl reductase [Rubrivivax sp.]
MEATLPARQGRIGPNAIIRVAEVLRASRGEDTAAALFSRAGMLPYLTQPPAAMVDENEVTRLHQVLRESLGNQQAQQVARQAGTRTAEYLLAHRIPRMAQAVLKRLPAVLAARALLAAIRGHAWTFAGSGMFCAEAGHPVVLSIRCNPMCRGSRLAEPGCDFYAATFEHLFRVLVHPASQVLETHCEACGDAVCRFEVRWR